MPQKPKNSLLLFPIKSINPLVGDQTGHLFANTFVGKERIPTLAKIPVFSLIS